MGTVWSLSSKSLIPLNLFALGLAAGRVIWLPAVLDGDGIDANVDAEVFGGGEVTVGGFTVLLKTGVMLVARGVWSDSESAEDRAPFGFAGVDGGPPCEAGGPSGSI